MVDAADLVFMTLCLLVPAVLGTPADAKTNVCRDGDTVFKEGQSWTKLGECQKYTCGEDGEVFAKTCAALAVEEGSGWKISKMDLTKRYPHCCPKPIPPPKGKPKESCDATKKEAESQNKESEDKKKTGDSKPDTDGDIVYSLVD